MPSTIQIQLPDGIPLLGAALMSTVFLLIYQASVVGMARMAANIQYPQVYADKAEEQASIEARKFNCAQRAHQNTLEYIPTVYLTTMISAIQHPKLAAALLAGWVISRFFYTRRYATGDPEKRNIPVRVGFLLQSGLIGTSLTVVGSSLMVYLGI
ncbi:hypothetical protein L218DRAFT_958156 [Marasmius fiardii PR-910]|nr:hypothetical protein L218DRAFT_958156 [Marasmius fiardii PR-910]